MAINLQVAVRMQDLFSRPLTVIQNATRNATIALNNFNATSKNIKSASLDGMTGSMLKMRTTLNALEEKKRQLSLWDTNGIKKCNDEIAALKGSMEKAKKAQEKVNSAMKNGNTDRIRQSYNEFNQEVRKTENIIKRNTAEQNKFNHSINSSGDEARKSNNIFSSLSGKIIGVAGAYASLQGIGSALKISDTMTQTTARLDMMNDGLQTTEELQQKIFQAAQRSRGSYQASADAISKMGILAGDAFKTNDEVIGFVEQLNKQFTIAGTSQEGISAAMLQLTQAMGSGVLRGEELNSVFEQAPTIIQSIADYLKVPIGQIRNMASKGQITANIVKTALLNSADETNKKFEKMPMTFGQIVTSIKNQALMAFQPVLKKINEIANSQKFQMIINAVINCIAKFANALTYVFDAGLEIGERLTNLVNIIRNNLSQIVPLLIPIATAILTVVVAIGLYNSAIGIYKGVMAVATMAQKLFNAELLACPLSLIVIGIIAIIAVVYLVIAAFNEFTDSSISATGVIIGALAAVGAFIYNLFLGVLDIVGGVLEFLYNAWVTFANFFGNVFKDPIGSIIRMFGDLGNIILGIVEKIASAIDRVFGSNLASAVSGLKGNLLKPLSDKLGNGQYEEKFKKLDINNVLENAGLSLDRVKYSNAYNTGYNFGKGIDSSMKGIDDKLKGLTDEMKGGNKNNLNALSDIANSVGDNNKIDEVGKVGNVGSVKNDVNVSEESLKALREFATEEYMQKTTNNTIAPVVNIKVAEVKETADINKLIAKFTAVLSENINISAEGAY